MDRQSAVLNEVVRESLLEKVRCDQRLEEGGRVSCTDMWGKGMRAGGGSSLREGLWMVACLGNVSGKEQAGQGCAAGAERATNRGVGGTAGDPGPAHLESRGSQ